MPIALLTIGLAGQTVPTPGARQLTEAWSQPLEDAAGVDVAVVAPIVAAIVGDSRDAGRLVVRRQDTGAAAWSADGQAWRSLVSVDDRLVAVDGTQAVAWNVATGREVWRTGDLPGPLDFTAAGGWLLGVGASGTVALSAAQGNVVWRQDLGPMAARAAITGDVAVVGLASGRLAGLDLRSGTERWRVDTGSPPTGLSVGDADVYVAFANGAFCSYRVQSGHVNWCHTRRIQTVGVPLIEGAVVHLAQFDNSLKTFDRRSGSLRRQIALGHRALAGPVTRDGALLVPLATGTFARVAPDGTLERIAPPGQAAASHVHRAVVSEDGTAFYVLAIPAGGSLTLSRGNLGPP